MSKILMGINLGGIDKLNYLFGLHIEIKVCNG